MHTSTHAHKHTCTQAYEKGRKSRTMRSGAACVDTVRLQRKVFGAVQTVAVGLVGRLVFRQRCWHFGRHKHLYWPKARRTIWRFFKHRAGAWNWRVSRRRCELVLQRLRIRGLPQTHARHGRLLECLSEYEVRMNERQDSRRLQRAVEPNQDRKMRRAWNAQSLKLQIEMLRNVNENKYEN